MSTEQDVHDVVAYPAFAYANTHPDTLAVIGMLHGLDIAPVERCRVLEVGCNEGANLIPMAYAIPGSQFVGFDIAGAPIARGQQQIQKLGLTNIQLFQASLMDVGESLGTFDYIIAHGVYAWVGEPARDRLLALCRERLAPSGIAFISYNALPGGHVKNMLRDILLQGMAGIDDPVQAVHQALEFLRIITESRPEGDPFRLLLEKELARLSKHSSHAVYHDELASEHRPISFSQFATHAAAHGLQYLGESTLPPPSDGSYNPQLANMVKALSGGDRIAHEQILDIVRMRKYRETLLCHAGHLISSDLTLQMIERLYLSSPAVSSPGEEQGTQVFTLPDGIRMESQHPATMLLMEHLIEAWPQSLSFSQMAEFLASRGIPLDAQLFKLLFQLVVSQMVQLHAWAAPVSRGIAERPIASATGRLEATVSTKITTLHHTTLDLSDPLVRQLLLLLDGTRDRAALRSALQSNHPELTDASFAEGLEPSLRFLHRAGVLLTEDVTERVIPGRSD